MILYVSSFNCGGTGMPRVMQSRAAAVFKDLREIVAEIAASTSCEVRRYGYQVGTPAVGRRSHSQRAARCPTPTTPRAKLCASLCSLCLCVEKEQPQASS